MTSVLWVVRTSGPEASTRWVR